MMTMRLNMCLFLVRRKLKAQKTSELKIFEKSFRPLKHHIHL